jgi:hypothetical protein
MTKERVSTDTATTSPSTPLTQHEGSNEKPQVFIDIDLADLRTHIERYDNDGWRFVNICGSTVTEGVELIYSFSNGLPLENLRFSIDATTTIPSVTDCFPNAFFFENETHDLFGVTFSDISIDFGGKFYGLSVPTPMNPRSTMAQEEAAQAEATNVDGDVDVAGIIDREPSPVDADPVDDPGDERRSPVEEEVR